MLDFPFPYYLTGQPGLLLCERGGYFDLLARRHHNIASSRPNLVVQKNLKGDWIGQFLGPTPSAAVHAGQRHTVFPSQAGALASQEESIAKAHIHFDFDNGQSFSRRFRGHGGRFWRSWRRFWGAGGDFRRTGRRYRGAGGGFLIVSFQGGRGRAFFCFHI